MHTKTEYINRLNELYIMNRSKYLLQKMDGSGYVTVSKTLHDGLVRSHLDNKLTLGCFAGATLNKFICFDVDSRSKPKQLTQSLIESLKRLYGISDSQILVSYSGDKGYHVELFFKDALDIKYLYSFYKLVLADLDVQSSDIEFRNTNSQAVKMPLSINRKTGNKCYLVDSESFEPLDNSHIFNIERVDTEFFLEQLKLIWGSNKLSSVKKDALVLDIDIAEEFEQVLSNMNINLKVEYQSRIIEMLERNSLLYESSRHDSTLLLSTFLREQGYQQEETIKMVYNLLENTWHTARHLISETTTLDYIASETERLVLIVYERCYSLNAVRKPVRVTKEDILFILLPKKLHLKKLLFTLLCHNKKYAVKDGSFYMTYKQMSEMGNTTERSRLLKYLSELEELSLLQIVSRNKTKEKSYLKHPNVYRLEQPQTAQENYKFVELAKVSAVDFGRVTAQLLTKQEIQKLVTAKQFRNSFTEYYNS